MRRRLEARLQRHEVEAEHRSSTTRDEALDAICRCMTLSELRRASDAHMSGDDARIKEVWSLLERGCTRLARGWTQADRDALAKQDQDKDAAVWRLHHALGDRHKLYPDIRRFDVLDVTEVEIKQLVEAAQNATCSNDLVVVADVVGRLRLDGRTMTVAEFEALVFRGEIAAPPPQPTHRI
jgi:hypothetical protein